MSGITPPAIRIAAGLLLLIPAGLILWKAFGPARRPDLPRWQQQAALLEKTAPREGEQDDAQLVRLLLDEKLGKRTFSFPVIVRACSGREVLPLDESPPHRRVREAIGRALGEACAELSAPDSPVRSQRRINEASRHFEELLRTKLDAESDLSCGIPPNRSGAAQRSGYPDLRIVHEPSGAVFYLDPKLVEDGSWQSTLRTFYFEPKEETLKVTEDAVHLLAGIGHDGNTGAWHFTGWKLVDLSTLRVRLKAEFQASNADIYPD